jgi:hypothetical protein
MVFGLVTIPLQADEVLSGESTLLDYVVAALSLLGAGGLIWSLNLRPKARAWSRRTKLILIAVPIGTALALCTAAFAIIVWTFSGIFEPQRGADVPRDAWNRIEVGMSTQQVVDTLGPPLEVMRLSYRGRYLNRDAWHYGWSAGAQFDKRGPSPCPLSHIVYVDTNSLVESMRLPSQIPVERKVARRVRRANGDSGTVTRNTNGTYDIWLYDPDNADLTPLRMTPIESIYINAIGNVKGLDLLRGMDSLKTINRLPASEFWERLDSGEFSDFDFWGEQLVRPYSETRADGADLESGQP